MPTIRLEFFFADNYQEMVDDKLYMNRCIQLARLGVGIVAPNPMVGALLVHEGKIIGEGYHEKYGESHAEVNCLKSVLPENTALIASSTMYVSLEPCSHYGKTPPCADLIIEKKIPKVVIGVTDPFHKVKGKGIEKLKSAGIQVQIGVLENESKELNRRFFRFHELKRPYIILKWAQSANSLMGSSEGKRIQISNEYSRRLVHKWRSEEASILVGTNTARSDDPELSNRFWNGRNPIRLVIDMDLKLPSSLKLFDESIPTVVFNKQRQSDLNPEEFLKLKSKGPFYCKVITDKSLVQQVMDVLYGLNIQSVLVEGGAKLLQSFIDEKIWDEIRLITNREFRMQDGLPAPQFEGVKIAEQDLFSDSIEIFKPK